MMMLCYEQNSFIINWDKDLSRWFGCGGRL